MPSQSPRPDTTPVVQNVGSLANCHNQQKSGLSGNAQLLPDMRRDSVPAGKMVSSLGESSIASTIRSQNFTPSSWLNNSCVVDTITRPITSNPSATLGQSINTPTSMLGTSSHSTPTPWETSAVCVVFSLASGIAITHTPLSGLDTLPTPISNPEARAIITNPLQTQATERIRGRHSGNCNHRQGVHLDQWSLAAAASIDVVTQTWRIMFFQLVDFSSSTCRTDGRFWGQATLRQ